MIAQAKKRRVERGVLLAIQADHTFLFSLLCRTLYRK